MPDIRATLRSRIAAALGWSEHDAGTLSLPSLRELVRPVSPKLAAECDAVINGGIGLTVKVR